MTKLRQVQISNYKNIAVAVVDLHPRLTLLVGPNGAGKSNFVDALSFVSESLSYSPQLAFLNRGGLSAVRRKSARRATSLGIRLKLDLDNEGWADYSFEISAKPKGAFIVARERCIVQSGGSGPRHEFEIEGGKFKRETPGVRARIEPDRLALPVLSALEEFRPVFDFLAAIRHYNLRPDLLRALQDPDPQEGVALATNGGNAAAVLRRIKNESRNNGHAYDRICRLLGQVAPGIVRVAPKSFGQKQTLEFLQEGGPSSAWHLEALNMSDGTLRVLGILLAIFQAHMPSVIAIEEPEAAVHPAAAEILLDILLEGNSFSQAIITTHSQELLDNKKLSAQQIRIVETIAGAAQITPLPLSTQEIIRERLYTAGELLRQDEIRIDYDYAQQASDRLALFGKEEA